MQPYLFCSFHAYDLFTQYNIFLDLFLTTCHVYDTKSLSTPVTTGLTIQLHVEYRSPGNNEAKKDMSHHWIMGHVLLQRQSEGHDFFFDFCS